METQVTQNKTDIAAINHGYYYFTDDLKHNNSNLVRFPPISNSYPFTTQLGDVNPYRLILYLEGYYHIIYTDFYKGSGTFKITHDAYVDLNKPDDVFNLSLDHQSDWTPITINLIKKIEKQGYPTIRLKFQLVNSNSNPILDGSGYSTFYIKYLHA